jgi:hypothetical protein
MLIFPLIAISLTLTHRSSSLLFKLTLKLETLHLVIALFIKSHHV